MGVLSGCTIGATTGGETCPKVKQRRMAARAASEFGYLKPREPAVSAACRKSSASKEFGDVPRADARVVKQELARCMQ